MTKDEALKLPAGRALDAIVAQKVMGMWQEHQGNKLIWWQPHCWMPGHKMYGSVDLPGYCVRGDCLPRYSESIEAAWQVVEKLRSEGYSTHIGTQNNGHVWTMQINKGGLDSCHHGYGDTPQLCICRAALKALWKD